MIEDITSKGRSWYIASVALWIYVFYYQRTLLSFIAFIVSTIAISSVDGLITRRTIQLRQSRKNAKEILGQYFQEERWRRIFVFPILLVLVSFIWGLIKVYAIVEVNNDFTGFIIFWTAIAIFLANGVMLIIHPYVKTLYRPFKIASTQKARKPSKR